MNMRKNVFFLSVFTLIALFAPFIANENPIFIKNKNGWHFSLFDRNSISWNDIILKDNAKEKLFIRTPVPWTPGRSDFVNSDFKSPFSSQYYLDETGKRQQLPVRYRHFLGTDLRGTDVLSGLIHGLQTSFATGISATLLAVIIAFITGVLSGWFAGKAIKIHIITFLSFIFLLVLFFIYLRSAIYFSESIITAAFILIIGSGILLLLYRLLKRKAVFNIRIPVDAAFTRINELFSSFPRFILILVLGAFVQPSFLQVVILLGITGWPDISRVFRSEVLRLRDATFMDAAKISGAQPVRLLFRHLFPNAWPVVSVSILYALALNILLESSLGFLGIGLPADLISLGAMMAQGKDHLYAWWLILFPGLLITIVLFCIFRVAESFRRTE